MSAHTQVRIASLAAAAYGALLVSGTVHHFQRTGSFRALGHSLAQPTLWVALLIAALVTFGLWQRSAWAWWLGIAAAGYQIFRIASSSTRIRSSSASASSVANPGMCPKPRPFT